jgi:sugar lactone lactonase YvrE
LPQEVASVVSTGGFTLNEAAGVAVDGAGNLYIADYGHNRIVLVKSTGAVSAVTITGLATAINQPAALAIDEAGTLYIADWGNSRVVKVTPAGVGYVLATGSYTLSTSGVTGVAVDASGNVYIADRIANHIVKVAASGAASLVSVPGLTLSNPQGVAVDGNGNLYIADSGHRRVIELTTAGTASVVQAPGQTIGTIMYGVTVGANGNIFAVDWSNNRVLKVDVSGSALSFANTIVGSTSSDSPKTATLTNLGNQALVISQNPSYPTDFPEDTGGSDLCAASTSLDAGEACSLSANFTPQSVGSRRGNILVTDNSLNASSTTQSVAVSGTGLSLGDATAVALSVSPTSVSPGEEVTITASVADIGPDANRLFRPVMSRLPTRWDPP